MALPSQTFGHTRFKAAKRRSRRRARPGARFMGVVVVAAVVVGAWWMLRAGFGSESSPVTKPALDRQRAGAERQRPLLRGPAGGSRSLASIAGGAPSSSGGADTSEDAPDDATGSGPAVAAEAGAVSEPVAQGGDVRAVDDASVAGATSATALLEEGRALWDANRPVEARDALNRALHDAGASEEQRSRARELLMRVSDLLTFSPRVVPGDEMSEVYTIASGDSLGRITRDRQLHVDWRLLMRINNIDDPRRIRVDQKIKLLRGPFHAVITKSAYRVDFYSDFRDSYGNRLYVKSVACGLGEFDSTPEGMWVVRQDSKLINPHWVNPRTRERFDADDPLNPIGERWIGLRGIDERTKGEQGYGIHGTIEPESIGQQRSMGCVRLLPDDVALAYELLVAGESTVEILP